MADAISSLQVVVEGKDETTRVLKGIESSIIRFVGAVSATLATINVAVFPVKNAAEFQKGLLDVGKTTEYTNKQLAELGDELKKLSYTTNVTAVDLAKVAAAGGQMGLGKESVKDLLAFTEATARMAAVLDVSFEEAGAGFGTLSNIFQIAARDAEKLGSLLNELSNNSTATGEELIDMVKRIGTAGGTLGIKQSAALAAVGKDLGLTSETVGTSFNKIFLDLQSKAADIAPLLGKPVTEFADLVRTDGIAALKEYINALAKMDNVQRAIVGEQITGGGRIFALVTSLVNDANNGYSLLDRHLKEANKGFDEGTSAINEQQRVLSGFLSQVQILKNVFSGLAESVGRQALPYLTRMAKALQEVGQRKEVAEFLQRVADAIGSMAVMFVDAVKYLAQFSSLLGPLIVGLKAFVALKIAQAIGGAAVGMVQWILRIREATIAWTQLLTAQQKAVQGAALQVAEAQSKAKPGTQPTVSTYGKVAAVLNSALAPQYAAATKATQEHEAAQTRLTKLTEQHAAAMQRVNDQIKYGKDNLKTMMQQSYDAVIAGGGTKKDANAAARNTRAQVNRAIQDMQVRGANYDAAFTAAITRQTAEVGKLTTAMNGAVAASRGMAAVGPIFSTIGAMASVAATAVWRFASAFLAIGGSIAAIVGLASYFLSWFGLLDPVTNALKRMFGILDSSAIERKRQDEQRLDDLENEKKKAEELGKIYEDQKRAARERKAQGIKEPAIKEGLDGGPLLADEVRQLEIIQGRYKDLTFKAAAMRDSVSMVAIQWFEVKERLKEAEAAYTALLAKTTRQQFDVDTGLRKDPVDTKELDSAAAKVDKLRKEMALLESANRASLDELNKLKDAQEGVAAEAIVQAQSLADVYDAAGVTALKALLKVKEAEEKLTEARKDLDNKSGGASKNASDEDKAAYQAAKESVRLLELELAALKTAYAGVTDASTAATVFMANAFPDALAASADKVKALLNIFSGVADGTDEVFDKQKKAMDEHITALEVKLAEIEAKRQEGVNDALARNPIFNSKADIQAGVEKVNTEAAKASLVARRQLDDAIARVAQIELERKATRSLADEVARLDATRGRSDAGQNLVANFAQNAALKAFTEKQKEAQQQVVKAAEFNSANIKKLYESAKDNLANVVNESKKEVQQLGQYLNGRNLTLRLANLGVQQGNSNDFFKKAQNEVVEVERKRLEALGMSSEEISKQITMLQEMFEWADRMRAAAQDEQKQRVILSESLKQIAEGEEAIAAAANKAKEYTKEAAAAAARGDGNAAAEFGRKAQVEAEKAKIAIEGLNEAVKTYKAEAAKPIVGPGGAKLIVSDEEVRGITNRAAEARVLAAQTEESALSQASSTAEKFAKDQTTKLTTLQKQAELYQQTLDAIAKKAPELGAAQAGIAEKILGNTAGMTEVAAGLKSIAESDFRGLDQFTTVAAQADKIKEMEAAIKNVADTYSKSIVAAGSSMGQLSESVVNSVLAGGASPEAVGEMVRKIQKGISDEKIKADITFPTAAGTLQEQLKSQEFVANIKFVSAGSVQKNAEGGHIRGPGSGTSDSILSWLSNGEYVSDAQTTAFFGPDFFRALKSLARGSRAGLTSIATKLSGGVRLPAFAGGGYVGSGILGATSGIAGALAESNPPIKDRVAVDFNVGNKTHTMVGEREQVDALVKALHKMNRG